MSSDIDLELAYAMERLILGGQLRLPCNCALDVVCTMPCTYWVRLLRYVHRCPIHHKKYHNHLLVRDPAWANSRGELIPTEEFTSVFRELAATGVVTLVPGIHFAGGKERHPSMLSLEGTHYIGETGRTEKLPLKME